MKKHIETPSRFIHYCIHCAMKHEESEMQEVMEQFLSNERKKMKGRDMEWISVEDKLPKEHEDVLVYYYANRNSKYFPECRYIKQDCYYDDGFECEEEVTHWMPIIDPPKQ